MPVPSSINDLDTVPANNFPAGTESPSTADDYFRAHAAFLASLRDRDAEDVPYLPAGAGAVLTNVQNQLRLWYSVTNAGAVGNGVANDATAVTNALQTGSVWFPQDTTYNLNGQDITISNSVTCYFGRNVKFTNGRLRFIPTDALKKVAFFGDVTFEDASIRVQGVANVAHTDQFQPDSGAVTFRCDNITVIDIFAGGGATTSVDLWNLKNSTIGIITVSGSAGGVGGSQAVLCQDIYDSRIEGISVSGGWVMGVHFDSSSLRAAYSLCRSSVGFVNAFKNIADESGDHGVYLHGAYKCEIGNVYAFGWGATISSCADFKFRDNLACYVRSVNVGRFRITADNNYSYFTQINRDNVFEDVYCDIALSMVATAPGYSLNNTIRNLRTNDMTTDSNEATQRGFVLTGICSIGVDVAGDDINAYGLTFEDATVTLVNTPDFVGDFFSARSCRFNNNLSLKPTSASTVTLESVRINGTFTHEGAFTATHAFIWSHVHVTGTISIASSGASRITTATWRYVSSDANEIADTTFRPETRNYRCVAFADAFYDFDTGNGTTVASIATVTLPTGGNFFVISGATGITSITASRAGRIVTLQFSGALTLTDGGNLRLAGNYTTTADDTLTLVCDGTNWIEMARSVN